MGCVYSRKSHCINRANKQRQPKLRAIVDDCQQRILPGIQQCLFACSLGICVRDVRLVLAAAQAMIDIHGQIKNPDKSGEITNLNDIDPFRRLNMEEVHELVANLKQVTEELQKRRREIDECQRSTKWWRNACNILFTLVTIGVIVGSVVLSALMAVPIAVTSGTAAGTLVKTVEQWISSVWEKRKSALEEEQKLVEKMQAALHVLASNDHLVSLLSLVEKVKSDYALLKFILKDVGADDDDEATAENKMKDMKTKINELTDCMDLLIGTADKCTKKIRRAELELILINY